MKMNWNCREFKITKYDSIKDYEENHISSVEIHHGNMITNNGLLAMWALAMGYNGTKFIIQENPEVSITPHAFTAYTNDSTPCSKIAIGNNSTSEDGTSTTISNPLGLLNVTSISASQSDNRSTITFTAEAGVDTAVGEWNEWGIYDIENGILFNRKVESMGNKRATSIWKVEIKIDLIRS